MRFEETKQCAGMRICGTGSCVPEQTITNSDMATLVETDDTWIRTRTGIQTRHFVEKETNLSLTQEAAKRAMEMAGVQPEEIGVCICATVTGDTLVPSLACLLQRELGLSNALFAFDMGAACTGFLYALHTAHALLCTMPEKRYALVTGSEVLSRLADFSDRSTCVLFGDGAGAAVIALDETAPYYFDCKTEGNDTALYCPRRYDSRNPFAAEPSEEASPQLVQMDGRAVYAFAVQALAACIRQVSAQAGGFPEKYICHQANARILQAAAKQLGEPMEKFFLHIAGVGNTSAASIPLALDASVRSGWLHRGDSVVLAGFGGGLSSGAMYLDF